MSAELIAILHAIPEFIIALVTSLAGYVTGGIVMACIWAWEHKHNRSISWRASRWVLWAFLLVSFFSVWYGMRPGLYAEIELRAAGENQTNHLSSVVMVVEVQNTGTPISIRSWLLKVMTPDGKQHDGISDKISVPITVVVHKYTRTYSAADALYEKSFREPIQQGKIITGVLLYSFHDVSQQDLDNERTRYILTFLDMNGASHKAIDLAKDLTDHPKDYPGLNP
jgi:hypothetical protein